MKIVFRTDSSVEIGTGHVMRCMTLAEELRKRGEDILFVSRELQGNINDLLEKKGFPVVRLSGAEWDWEQDAERTKEETLRSVGHASWLVIDHYGIDLRWERMLRSSADGIMVIDDLADREHDCDVLLDQNLYDNQDKRYDGLIPPKSLKLLGPSYSLLRPQFIEARRTLGRRDGTIKRILILFGGTDPTGETGKALDAMQLLHRNDIAADVVVGVSNPQRKAIQERCATIPNVTFHCQIDDMATLMASSDLAISAGGATTWEKCCLGLPSLIIAVAQNQIAIAEAVARTGAATYLGTASQVTSAEIFSAFDTLLKQQKRVAEQGRCAFNLVDGTGVMTVTSVLLARSEQKRTVLLLGPPRPELMELLQAFGDDVRTTEDLLTAESDVLQDVDFIISYGYRHILGKEVLDKFTNRAVNLHISFLPWNKGADPNLWSILEDTPKGVTIHYMDEKLDNGNIVAQQEVGFDLDDTLQTSYAILSRTVISLFRTVWPDIRTGRIISRPMPPGGSYHSLRDRKSIEHLLLQGWDTPIRGLIGTVKKAHA